MVYMIDLPYEIHTCQECPFKHMDKGSTKCIFAKNGEKLSFRAGTCPLLKNRWQKGKPTEEGWYLIKYECIYEGRYKGNIAYSTFKIQIYDDGYIDFSGGIGSDEVWQPVEYLRIGDVWKPKEAD